MLKILSLGAGMQSSAILLMAIEGEIELDHAIFADTGWESPRVYDYLRYLMPLAEAGGIAIHVLGGRSVRREAIDLQRWGRPADRGGKWASLPYFTLGPNGERGMVRRQCTYDYKVLPINRKIKELLGLGPRQWWPKEAAVRKIYGISAEETRRVREPEKWAINCYPLIERGMTRLDCLAWVERHGFRRPPTSSCIGCPFHSNEEWQGMKSFRPEEFADAVEFDAAMRKCSGMRGDVFLHSSRQPLSEVKFDIDQTSDMFAEECFGLCGT